VLFFAGHRKIRGVCTRHRTAACQHPRCACIPGCQREDSQPDHTDLDSLQVDAVPGEPLVRLCAGGIKGCIFRSHASAKYNGYCCGQCRDHKGHGMHCDALVVDFVKTGTTDIEAAKTVVPPPPPQPPLPTPFKYKVDTVHEMVRVTTTLRWPLHWILLRPLPRWKRAWQTLRGHHG
jgi:hypothetical protein